MGEETWREQKSDKEKIKFKSSLALLIHLTFVSCTSNPVHCVYEW